MGDEQRTTLVFSKGSTSSEIVALTFKSPPRGSFSEVVTATTETPSPNNPLGAKGIGESGTIGSTPAVQNAVVDALSHLGIRHIDMPLTPERVMDAIAAAGQQGRYERA